MQHKTSRRDGEPPSRFEDGYAQHGEYSQAQLIEMDRRFTERMQAALRKEHRPAEARPSTETQGLERLE
jgi:hypothetical protein